MLLTIDVGNTNCVFAVHDGERFVADWRCGTDVRRTGDEYFVWLDQLMRHAGLTPEDVTDVALSSTAPRAIFNLRVLCEKYFGATPLIVGRPGCELGIEVRVDPHTRVGADRLVNAVAAHRSYEGELIVVDFGTATTLDVVAADGAYEGGVIAPGVNLSLRALHEAAAALPEVEVARPERVVGTNTVACMQSGIYWGYVSMIEGLCRRIMQERGKPMTVIATGGLSPLFARGAAAIDHVDRDLTLRGLVAIHELNKKGR
ncbi:type III pantothenate kinase [Oceanicella actignis]|uniref:Type III pantothenate kinase n=1 Tax=Oceanicella actignis TaxID=1189325 RepID=A0A1M7RZW5_9RHOB|nr:type III pantothenate kinase [Oceanicella actignis]TYO90066.1 type III pantothenate kinase [Oceanicella actignis]SES94485.1 type III pantothenate kinase [Oceanicella actignis]SHN51720.1 type III pantothenate kinase [Oceanicella actignis]